MNVREAAKKLEVNPSLVYGLIASGKLRCCRIGHGRGVIRISEEQLADYLRQSEPVKPAVPAAAPARMPRLKHLNL